MGKKLGLDAAYAKLGKGYLQYPVINSVKPKPKPTKAMSGGMMQGYGAARTSGMGLEDQSLMPGQMVRASEGKMLSAKQKKIARMAPPPDKITGADFKAMKAKYGKMIKMDKGGGMDMGAKKSLTFKQQLAKARAEGKVGKTSHYIKRRVMGDKLNALLKTIK
jgi:hypothetical protein